MEHILYWIGRVFDGIISFWSVVVMRICVVSVQWIPIITGGGGVSVVNLVREISKNHDVIVYCFGLGDLLEEEIIALEGSRVKVRRFFTRDSRQISNPFEGSKRDEIARLKEFADHVVRALDCTYFDVIHLHGHFVVPSIARRLRRVGVDLKFLRK